MKRNLKLQYTLALAGAALFFFLFWGQGAGLNFPLFTLFVLGAAAVIYPVRKLSRSAFLLAAAVLLMSLMVMLHSTLLAVWVYFLVLIVFAGFLHAAEIRSVMTAALSGLLAFLSIPVHFARDMAKAPSLHPSLLRSWNVVRIGIFPVFTFFIFMGIYRISNPEFNSMAGNVFDGIWNTIEDFFTHISFGKIFFVVLGFFVTGMLIFPDVLGRLQSADATASDELQRQKRRKTSRFRRFGRKLQREYWVAITTFILLNLLILLFNIVDIKTVWIEFEYHKGELLKGFVHEGTYMLILSILLSMALTLWFFRRNLNFLKGNKLLMVLASLWLLQNVVMVVSVGFRVYYYVQHFGLAYLRIGLVFFLALTLFGLATSLIKINRKKSAFYLVRMNSAATLSILVFMSFFNWDVIIARYNFAHADTAFLHLSFIVQLPERTYHVLEQNKDIMEEKATEMDLGYNYNGCWYVDNFENNKATFLENYPKRNWRSWNWADAQSYAALKKMSGTAE